MLNWFRDRFAAGPPTKNINTVAPFLTLAYLYEEKPESTWLPYLDEWAEWLMDGLPRTEENGFQHIVFNSENREQLWDDTLMMSVLPLAKIGTVVRPAAIRGRSAAAVHAAHQVPGRSQDRAVVSRLDLRRPPPFRQRAVGARQLLGDHRDSRIHRAAGPAARRWPARVPARDAPAADPHAGEAPGRGRPVAHADRRSEVLSRGLGHGRLRVRNPEIRAQGLHRRRVRRSRRPRGQSSARQYRHDRRAQERLVRHAGVQRSGWLPQDPAHLDALRPGHGHPRARRIQARVHN